MIFSSPLPPGAGACRVIRHFLTPTECAEWIALSEGRGYASAATDYPPTYRNNDRHVLDAPALAARLGERLRVHAPASVQADGRTWRVDGINERLRFCRYGAGQRFSIHQDGIHHRGPDCRSHLTVLIYLSDGAAFSGGDTVFYAQGPGGDRQELGRVRPEAGTLLLFDHAIWHAGEEVTAGVKHVLRSDVLYRAAASDDIVAAPAHLGYVWTLAALTDGLFASGGRDPTIRIWDGAGQAVRQLHGHTQSVLGLAPLPDGRLASVSRDRTLRLWNWAAGACDVVVTAHDTAVLDVIALPDGRLATAGADGAIKLWLQDGSVDGSRAGHAGWVWQLARLGGGRIASASEDGTVRVWDVTSLQCTAVLAGDQPLRTVLAVDGAIWTGDIAGRMTCWREGEDGWRQSMQFDAHRATVRRLRHLGDGVIASCGEDCALRTWRAGLRAPVFEAHHTNFVTDALHHAGALLASSYDGRIDRHVA